MLCMATEQLFFGTERYGEGFRAQRKRIRPRPRVNLPASNNRTRGEYIDTHRISRTQKLFERLYNHSQGSVS